MKQHKVNFHFRKINVFSLQSPPENKCIDLAWDELKMDLINRYVHAQENQNGGEILGFRV